MIYSTESVYNSFLKLTAKPESPKVKTFINTFIECLQRNEMKILTNNDNFTVGDTVILIFDIERFERVFSVFDGVFGFEMIEENKYLLRALIDNKNIHMMMHIVFTEDEKKYAKSNNYEIVSFNKGI